MKAIANLILCFAAALLAPPVPAQQAFPAKPVILVCPWPPGGSSDVAVRILSKGAAKHLGQPVVVENRPGAVGSLGAAAVARAQPDGYLLTQSLNSVLRQPFLAPTAYDPAKDFTYIIGVSEFPFGLVVRSDAPWRTLQEFLEDARGKPGNLNIAVPGRGSPGHYIMDGLAERAQTRWTTVPFKGTTESLQALLGGHVSAAAESTGWAPYVDSGRLRLLAVFTAQRLTRYPDVPTLKELGFGLVDRSPWGIVGPRGMDPAVVKTLHSAFQTAMAEPEFLATLAAFGNEPQYMTGEQYLRFALDMIPMQKALVEKYGLKAQ